MKKTSPKIINGLRKAIEAENQGHYFYTMASKTILDPKGREVFQTLALEELGHARYLSAQYKSFLEKGKPDPQATLGSPKVFSGEHPIFSPDLKNRIGTAHFEMTALSIGIQLELSSELYYRNQSKAATNRDVKRFFRELADWEAGHYQALLGQQSVLKEDYWASGGFAPF